MGGNKLPNMMPMGAKEAGLDRKTNHSVRKTTIKTLRKAGVPRDKIKHISGHKSTSSIEAYDDDLSP
jgi:integrase